MDKHFVKASRVDEIEEGGIKTVMVQGRGILLIRQNDAIYALENVCSHDGGPLGEGYTVDNEIECPRHGARFDIKTGQATQMPAIVGIENYEVKVENGEIFVAVQSRE